MKTLKKKVYCVNIIYCKNLKFGQTRQTIFMWVIQILVKKNIYISKTLMFLSKNEEEEKNICNIFQKCFLNNNHFSNLTGRLKLRYNICYRNASI